MRMKTRVLTVVFGVAVTAAGCGGGAADEPSTTEAAAVSTTSAGATAPTTTTAAATTTTAAPAPEGDMLLAGLTPITMTTPAEGGSIRPELAWEPIEGADHYAVYLYAPDGRIYWTWRGYETSVPVGGRPALPDAATGPSVIAGMSWAVIAYDADLLPIGSSVLAPISP